VVVDDNLAIHEEIRKVLGCCSPQLKKPLRGTGISFPMILVVQRQQKEWERERFQILWLSKRPRTFETA
jgi:hypothetical protein